MKDMNCKTNRPLTFAILGNTLLMILNLIGIRGTEIGEYLMGGALSFTATALLIAIWNRHHETTVSEWKKSLFAGLKK